MRPERSGQVAACALASCVVGVGAAVASWWLIGNQSVHTGPPEELDYAFHAPDAPRWMVAVFGPIGLFVVVAALGWLAVGASRHVIERRWLQVAGLLGLAGFVLAGIGRIATAGVIGANIGAGLGIMALPFVAGLVVWSVFIAFRIFDAPKARHST